MVMDDGKVYSFWWMVGRAFTGIQVNAFMHRDLMQRGSEQPGLQIKGFQERTQGGNFSGSCKLTSVCNCTIGLEPPKGLAIAAMAIQHEPKSSQTQCKNIPTLPNMTQLVHLVRLIP